MSSITAVTTKKSSSKTVADWPSHFGQMGSSYEKRAFTGSALSAQAANELDVVLSSLGRGDGRKVLDIGAGTGRFTVALIAAGWNVTSFDGSTEMLECIAERAPQATLVLGRLGEPLPFEAGSFAAVVAMRVVKYVPQTADALTEMVRVVEPQGCVVFDVANQHSFARFGYADSPMGFVTPKSLRQTADQVGLVIDDTQDGFRLPHAIVGRSQSAAAGQCVNVVERGLARVMGRERGARSIIVRAHSRS